MRRVVVDASALAALTFLEPGRDAIGQSLDGATVFAPSLLKYEMANIVVTRMRRVPAETRFLLEALHRAIHEDWGIAWHDVDATEAALVARTTGLTAYDASYVWLAGYLGAELVTLDKKVIAATARGQA
jgi:predicted nucleic acid-binding protein